MNGPLLSILDGNQLGGLSRAVSGDPATNRPPGAIAVGWLSAGRRRGPDPVQGRGSRRAGGAEREGGGRG